MKVYNLTLAENKLVSSIVMDLTDHYHAKAMTKPYESGVNDGFKKVRQRARQKGLLLDDVDLPPTKNILAIVKEDNG